MFAVVVLAPGVVAFAEDAVPSPPVAEAPLAADTRELALRHVWTRETLTVVYRENGAYVPEALDRINHLMRDHRCEKTIAMDVKLLDLLWELNRELAPRGPIGVVSAYRSEGYNASLLRAGRVVDPHSRHMFGQAVDVVFPGVPLAVLKDAAARRGLGGVGHYPFSGPPFVHLDTGPARRWEEMHPAQRRALNLPVRARQRLRIDCDLKMADVLSVVSETEALAMLPEGASSEVSPRLAQEGADAPPPSPAPPQQLAIAAAIRQACEGGAPCASGKGDAARAAVDPVSRSALGRIIASVSRRCGRRDCAARTSRASRAARNARFAVRRRARVRRDRVRTTAKSAAVRRKTLKRR
ncbi:MAG: DUF882 domain-containing protein [Hyphomicrobiales bacterium]|nr:DUF882 domain-containing protein [Hyphomicrobiales bacterium]